MSLSNLNPNHRNTILAKEASVAESFEVEAEAVIAPAVEEAAVEEVPEAEREELEYPKLTADDLYVLNRLKQVELLTAFGLSKREIKKLRTESDRVKKLLELQDGFAEL